MLLQQQLTFHGKTLKTEMIQNIVLIGMVLKEINLMLLIYLSPGIYKLVLIFHYLLELTQQLVAGHGPTGIKLDGLLLANLDLIWTQNMTGHSTISVEDGPQQILSILQILFSQMETLIHGPEVELCKTLLLTTSLWLLRMELII